MKISHIEHIGIAVHSLDEAIPYWESLLGSKCYNIEEVVDQRVRTAFFRVGEVKIELLESTSDDGPIAKFIEKRGAGVHHLAFAVDNIDEALSAASERGIQLIDQSPRLGAEGLSIAFMHPKSTLGVLTEFCEDRSKSESCCCSKK